MAMSKEIFRQVADRFDFSSPLGCWEWTGNHRNGYGRIKIDGKVVDMHRFMYTVFNGEIPNGLFICHKCDNKKCCNPDHLWAGTCKENAEDAVKKGLLKREQCINGHIYTEVNLYISSTGARGCKICRRARQKKYDDSHRDILRARNKVYRDKKRAKKLEET